MRTHLDLKLSLCLIIFTIAIIPAFADDLIYNNSELVEHPSGGYAIFNTYNQQFDEFNETVDFGRSDGGRISKFAFDYGTTGSYVGPINIRFYRNTDERDIGYDFKSFTVYPPPTDNNIQTFTHVIPASQRFDLQSGDFGYSFQTDRESTYIALASGGEENQNYMWERYTWLEYDERFSFVDEIWTGFSMSIFIESDPNSVITGCKYDDLNANGSRDVGEPGIEGWEIYADANGNRLIDPQEPNTITDPNGLYTLKVPYGANYAIREVSQDGWNQTQPGASASEEYPLYAEPNEIYNDNNFGGTTQTTMKYTGDIALPEGVEINDLIAMADQWLEAGLNSADIAPAQPDGKVNLSDFAALAENWMLGTDKKGSSS